MRNLPLQIVNLGTITLRKQTLQFNPYFPRSFTIHDVRMQLKNTIEGIEDCNRRLQVYSLVLVLLKLPAVLASVYISVQDGMSFVHRLVDR